jgi:DUF4097 and DUF4098 domain-containing protein YvlB
MAGYPPPYPPPPGAPFGFDPRQQARFIRRQMQDQLRAQKAAFRAQRLMYRAQARAMRRSSILGPLLVISIGVILLLVRLGSIPASTFFSLYGHWWPLIFVAAGIVLLLEWAFDHRSQQEGAAFVRRGVGGGVIFLLIVMALTGAGAQAIHSGLPFHDNWHVDDDDLSSVFGERHEFEQEIDEAFPRGSTLNVQNPHGDVTVVGKSDDNKVHVVVNKQVYSWGGSDASSKADELSPRLTSSGGTIDLVVPTVEGGQADLAITLPEKGQITIIANHGAITVSNMKAPVNATANHGDIEVDRIDGQVTAHLNHNGSSFTAHSVQGDVNLRGHADDINITDVAGAVSMEGEFFGDAHLEHLTGPVGFRTNRTQFTMGKLDGMVDISPDEELTGSQIIGPTELRTRSRNIALERVTGSVEIVNSNGTVDLTNAAPLGNISIENQKGEVTVTVPDNAGISVEAQTRDGAIEDDLDNFHDSEEPVNTHSVTIGDGAAHLVIHNTHADINIHKAVVEPPTPPVPPAPVAPQAAPETPRPARPSHPSKPAAAEGGQAPVKST